VTGVGVPSVVKLREAGQMRMHIQFSLSNDDAGVQRSKEPSFMVRG
jgi:hypothetical protein